MTVPHMRQTGVEPMAFPTTWLVNRGAPPHEWIQVALTCFAGEGPHKPLTDTYAIRKGGLCLNDADEWVFEPIPSSRDDEFFAHHRWSLDEALVRAQAIARREDLWRRDAR